MPGSDAPVAPFLDSLSGQVVDGRYKIGRLIGKGAMGVVYEAEHVLVGRKVAVKFGYAGSSSGAFERFHREAKAAASVGNPHIVDVLDMGRLDAGTSYMVLERLEGADLAFTVASEGRFSVRRALDVVTQLCDALSAVHAIGIVHRDLKPENVFLTRREGRADFVKVLDFGVCKVRDAAGAQLTASGDAIGTPQFMAPEQAEARKDVDQRSDLYSLGAILYFLLADEPPFQAANLPQLLIKVCYEEPPHLSEGKHGVPEALDAIVQRALAKNPEQRFQSCAELKAALAPFLEEVDALASTAPIVQSVRPRESAAPALSAGRTASVPTRTEPSATVTLPMERTGRAGAAALLLVLVGTLLFLAFRQNAAKPEIPAPRAPSALADTSPLPAPALIVGTPAAAGSEPLGAASNSAPATAPAQRASIDRPVPPRAPIDKKSVTAAPSASTPIVTPPAREAEPVLSTPSPSAPAPAARPYGSAGGVGISRPLKDGI